MGPRRRLSIHYACSRIFTRRRATSSPQSEVAGLINQYGMIPIQRRFASSPAASPALAEARFGCVLVAGGDLDNVWWIIQTIYRESWNGRVYDGVELTIPVGENRVDLGQMTEFRSRRRRRKCGWCWSNFVKSSLASSRVSEN